MKEHPILFSTEMVRAILSHRKTQTRRLVKNVPIHFNLKAMYEHSPAYIHSQCSFGRPGDLLWVRESFNWIDEEKTRVNYKAQYTYPEYHKWKPSIHMPKLAARIWLEITDVRVERLQDISDEDAIAEGIETFHSGPYNEMRYRDYFDGKRRSKYFDQFPEMKKQTGFGSMPWPDWRYPVTSFSSLWQSIHGKDSWDANPWVWVISFKVLSTTGKPQNLQA
ncbi:MAG: hypothetical protein PHG67_09795 [Bacteroidales bacterium]|jgi:hypothetical protein|nr:hypothetical protein [Bacteroidales bacterium]